MKTVNLFGKLKMGRLFVTIGFMGILTVVLMTGSGCSVYMAAKQPDAKDLNVFAVGTPRNMVLSEIGQPQASEVKNGKRVDVFAFVQGYSKGAKTGRAVAHGVADVFTLGLWEVVGTPTEAVFDGDKMSFEVTYDSSDKVEKVVKLSGPKEELASNVSSKAEDVPQTSQPKTDKEPPGKTGMLASTQKTIPENDFKLELRSCNLSITNQTMTCNLTITNVDKNKPVKYFKNTNTSIMVDSAGNEYKAGRSLFGDNTGLYPYNSPINGYIVFENVPLKIDKISLLQIRGELDGIYYTSSIENCVFKRFEE